MARPKVYYWDSSVFIALFNDETGAENVAHFIVDAEQDRAFIVVSGLTPVEVLKMKGKKPITKAEQETIRGFFKKSYFHFIDLTRRVGERAQSLIWDHPGLWPKDAVHLASAIEFETAPGTHLDAIHSFDEDFLKLNGKLPTKAPITEPIPSQAVMRRILDEAKKAPKKSN